MALLPPPPLPGNFCQCRLDSFFSSPPTVEDSRCWLAGLAPLDGICPFGASRNAGVRESPSLAPGQTANLEEKTRAQRPRDARLKKWEIVCEKWEIVCEAGHPGSPRPASVTSLLGFPLLPAPKSDWQEMALKRWK